MGRQVRFDGFRFDPETARLWAGLQEARLAGLRADPRFGDLLRRMGLAH
jgi:hypothetical protein